MIAIPIITASYGAVLASFVAVETVQVPFTTVEEFLENGQYKLLLTRNTFVDQYFRQVRNIHNENSIRK